MNIALLDVPAPSKGCPRITIHGLHGLHGSKTSTIANAAYRRNLHPFREFGVLPPNIGGISNASGLGMPLSPFPDQQTYKVIGAGMAVHSELGCGFLEKVYKVALPLEFERQGVPFEVEETLKISYKGRILPISYYVDFICFDSIVVEVKALDAITSKEEAQLLNYLKATGMRRGLLLNFGARSFQHKRMVLG